MARLRPFCRIVCPIPTAATRLIPAGRYPGLLVVIFHNDYDWALYHRQSDSRMKYFVHIEDWVAWTADPDCQIRPGHALDERIAEPVLPRLLRRRLNASGRAACEAVALLDEGNDQPLIHASRHGDVSSSLEMLQDLASDNGVSPARFSMSVHNAVLGVYSMARGHHGPTLALGASGYEFDALINEAQGYLACGYSSVIAVFSEGDVPLDYQPYTESPACPCVVALKLTAQTGIPLQNAPTSNLARPTPLDIIHWLNQDDAIMASRQQWHQEQA